MLLSASGLSNREAARVLCIPYTTLCAWTRHSENDTTAGPSDSSLELLENISRNIASEIIESECREEARHLLEPTELFQMASAYPQNQSVIRFIMQGSQLPEKVFLNVVGRVGPIGWIQFVPEHGNVSNAIEQLTHLIQDEYHLLTNRVVPKQSPTELVKLSRWRFQTVKRILRITNVELAQICSTSTTKISEYVSDRSKRPSDRHMEAKVRRILLEWAIARTTISADY